MHYYRKAGERGEAHYSWLHSRHTFSFGNYYDPAHNGFSVLRVINDDRVAPSEGFGSHSHKDMEIISYVLEGSIEHKDGMGNVSQLKAGEIQRMSAGTGVVHSEYNASADEPLRFLQIWIQPGKMGVTPGYETLTVEHSGALTALVTPGGLGNTLSINQDATLYHVKLVPGEAVQLEADARAGYLHGIAGSVQLEDLSVTAGDGVGIACLSSGLELVAGNAGFQGLWFDLPPM